jgi:hypothetical protein
MPELRKPVMVIAAGLLVLAALPALREISAAAAQPAQLAQPARARVTPVRSGSPVKFLPPRLTVPRASTSQGPALAALNPPGGTPETALFWTEPPPASGAGSPIAYETSTNLRRDVWSPVGIVDGTGKGSKLALTSRRPSATQLGSAGEQGVFVTWEGAADQRVWFTIGAVDKSGKLTWPQPPQFIPGAFTLTGPTVFAPLYSKTVFVAWEAAKGHRIDFVVGRLAGQSVKWGAISAIPGADTTDAPGVAEASVGLSSGRLYVFWRDLTGQLAGAFTADPLGARPVKWAPVRSTADTGTGPAATAIGKGSSFPILLVYRAKSSSALLYATLNSTGPLRHTSGEAVRILTTEGQDSPALTLGVLAATDPGEIHFVRVCPGC